MNSDYFSISISHITFGHPHSGNPTVDLGFLPCTESTIMRSCEN